jgi:hypothetical protein
MNRAPAFSDCRIPLGMWASGMLLLLGAIWLGLLAIEYGLAALAPGATGAGPSTWTEQTLFGAIASVVSMAIGVLIYYLCRNRHPHARIHHQRHESHRPNVARPSETEVHTPSPISASGGDESVSFDMDEPSRDPQLPPDTPGGPPQRTKVKVRVKQRIRLRKK